MHKGIALLLAVFVLSACQAPRSMSAMTPLRVATFNTALSEQPGLRERLAADDQAARQLAAIIQRVRPDILLLNEFDYEADGEAARRFIDEYLAQPALGGTPLVYPYHYHAEVNTGVPSGLDLSGDGRNDGPADAWGFGAYPGQYGMLVLSRYPIAEDQVRTFRQLRWADMPGALRPLNPDGSDFYSDNVWQQLRLSSKSHWDVPIDTPLGRVHLLAAHPTPPAFDGPERRNQRRNHDELRLWADYLEPQRAAWIVDDQGRRGGLPRAAYFVIAGDYNADPVDGSSWPGAIQQLLAHPRVQDQPPPTSLGGAWWALADAGINLEHRGDPAQDTARFSREVGNLRVDYVLPSRRFRVVDAGVYWPLPEHSGAEWVQASDHRLVWVDLMGSSE